MKSQFFVSLLLSVLFLNLVAFSLPDVKSDTVKKAQVNQLVTLLPASDIVVTLDAKRLFGEALPRILSSNQPVLDKVLAHLEELKTKTGVDLRQFEYLAVGAVTRKTGPKSHDIDPVVLARGQMNAGALIGAAKLGLNGKYREVRIGERNVYVFQMKNTAPKKPTGANDKAVPATAPKTLDEIAVTAFDANTLAVGSLARVRQTVDAKTKVSSELLELLGRKEVAVANFAVQVPAGMSTYLPMENDELGKNVNSIRYVFGSLDVTSKAAMLSLTAKTTQASQAQNLVETLQGLQMLGKAFLGRATTPDKQVFSRMIDNARIAANGNEVSLELSVPQSDIDVLVGKLK